MSFCIRDLSAEDSWTNTNRIFTSIKKSKHKYMHVYNGGKQNVRTANVEEHKFNLY